MRKLHTYALQTEAFVHLDGDAYLFAPLPVSLTEAPLLAQNLEYDHPYYLDAVRTLDWVDTRRSPTGFCTYPTGPDPKPASRYGPSMPD